MYKVVQYGRYPIYEHAEGGYYYEGLELHYRLDGEYETKEDACAAMQDFVDEYNAQEGLEPGDIGYMNCLGGIASTHERYIGMGLEFHVERKDCVGENERGRQPYC